MAVSAFALKVWHEVEQPAVIYTGNRLRAMPQAAYELVARFWEWVLGRLDFWSFERLYRRRLYEDYGLFNDRGLGLINANRLDLEQVYVELRIKSDPNLQPSTVNSLSHRIDEREPIWTFLRVLKPGHALALTGTPGSGKTTLLQHLLLVFARNRQGRRRMRRQLPIFVELRALSSLFLSEDPPSLPEAIRSYWRDSSRIKDLVAREPRCWLERRLRTGRVLVLLDGLDEVPAAQRKKVAHWMDEQMRCEDHRRCRFVLTSRRGAYKETFLEQAQELEVQPFFPEQADRFIERWYLANAFVTNGRQLNASARRFADEKQADLRRRLASNPNLNILTRNPLLLTMVCMVHCYLGALPHSRSQLYAEICQVLLERWRSTRNISDRLRGEQKLGILRPLAAHFMNRQLLELPEAEVVTVIQRHLELVGPLGPGAELQFLHEIQEGSGLLLERERGLWSFAHKTFQEFLTAEHWLLNPALAGDWPAKVRDEWWRETLLLYSAKSDASAIVQAALELGPPAGWALAWQCLEEAKSLTPGVRALAEGRLRGALNSAEALEFRPAAQTLLHRRMTETVTLSDKLRCRASPITQAEYQLFIDATPREQQAKWLPPHWKATRFSGTAGTPVTGVYPEQARAFAGWLNETAFHAGWRLPRMSERGLLPPQPVACWCEEEGLSDLPESVSRAIQAWSGTDSARYRLISHPDILARVRNSDPEFKIAKAAALARIVNRDLGSSLGFETEVVEIYGRSHDHVLSAELANDVFAVGQRAFGSTEDRALDEQYAEKLIKIFGRGFDQNLPREVMHAGDIRAWRQALVGQEANASARDRLSVAHSLLTPLLDVLEATDHWAARDAWRQFLLVELSVVRSKLDKSVSEEAGLLATALHVLNDRGSAQPALPPWEGILLVQDGSFNTG